MPPTVIQPQAIHALLTTEQAAEVLGVQKNTLDSWRSRQRGPKYVKLSRRLIRYRLSDLLDWAKKGEHTPALEPVLAE